MMYAILLWVMVLGFLFAFNAKKQIGLLLGYLLFFGSFISLIFYMMIFDKSELLNKTYSEEYRILDRE